MKCGANAFCAIWCGFNITEMIMELRRGTFRVARRHA